MLVREAREQARAWVGREASRLPGFVGAYLTGSTKWKQPDEPHPPSSDVDVRVVVDPPGTPARIEKQRHGDILLEASVVTRESLGSAEQLVQDPFLGGSLWNPVLLADPSGDLAALADRVGAAFPRRRWVEARTARVRALPLRFLQHIEDAETLPEQVGAWLFGTSATTLPLLAAGLRNLTVKRRYAESRALLADQGRLDLHEEMLSWLGCAEIAPECARRHLAAVAAAFDATMDHVDPSFRFAADLRSEARPVAVEACAELIDAGLHREAIFWLGATFSRCLLAHRADVPRDVRELCDAGLRGLLRDLGVETRGHLVARAERVRTGMAKVAAAAEQIIDSTAGIFE